MRSSAARPARASMRRAPGFAERLLDADRLGCPRQRVLGALDGEGAAGANAGSVAAVLDEALRDGRILPGHHVLLCALGGGLTWGSAVVRM
ncbi:3-oxoacyl-[acyl-carrier-protein] synthase III C-terminal domain-containing protein [Sorangium sp. So ce362]|uniref:3-oxoacyl-[acyl-carrier-protein] synthase III C-terminal domain-containing protein n=1 Tax=Sorangium sp. So ce362 TaxID=3133303 RepID=UPI003F63F073